MSSGTSRISFNTMPLFFRRSSSFSRSAATADAEKRIGRAANTMLKTYVISFFMSRLLLSGFSASQHLGLNEQLRPPFGSPLVELFVSTVVRNSILELLFHRGGKCANIFCTPLSRFLVFLSALLDSVSLDDPRQTKFLVLASNRSTTRVPTW